MTIHMCRSTCTVYIYIYTYLETCINFYCTSWRVMTALRVIVGTHWTQPISDRLRNLTPRCWRCQRDSQRCKAKTRNASHDNMAMIRLLSFTFIQFLHTSCECFRSFNRGQSLLGFPVSPLSLRPRRDVFTKRPRGEKMWPGMCPAVGRLVDDGCVAGLQLCSKSKNAEKTKKLNHWKGPRDHSNSTWWYDSKI